jgi:hypothetical protein
MMKDIWGFKHYFFQINSFISVRSMFCVFYFLLSVILIVHHHPILLVLNSAHVMYSDVLLHIVYKYISLDDVAAVAANK